MSGPALAQKWVCSGCDVTIGRMDGQEAPLPDSWERAADGDLCLSCRRGRAADAAQEATSSDESRATRGKARRNGLIEFEVRRTPELTDGTIAKACRTSSAAVAAARTRLGMSAGPPSGPGRATAARPRR
ncbi:MAG TPA: hypothetical protein VFU04_06260 [Solirubrobacterales bacterium]|nr:hypothetical protein [Solirubrobacterales bacterium]